MIMHTMHSMYMIQTTRAVSITVEYGHLLTGSVRARVVYMQVHIMTCEL